MSIERIFLSSDDREYFFSELPQDFTDVIVCLDTQEKYAATFFTFDKIIELNMQHKLNNEFLTGNYFWQPNMILVQLCEREMIEQVINDLWDEGDFFRAFRKIGKT